MTRYCLNSRVPLVAETVTLHPKLGLPEKSTALTTYSTCQHGLKRRRCPICQREYYRARRAA